LVAAMSNNGTPDYNYIWKFWSWVNFSAWSNLQVPSSSSLNIWWADFTIDWWLRFNNITKTQQWIFGRWDLNWVSLWYNEGPDYKLHLRLWNWWWINWWWWTTWTKTNWVNNQWYHFAVVKYWNLYSVYIDWNLEISYSTPSVNDPANTFTIWNSNNNAYYLAWVVDEFRFSKWIARWTWLFSPPNSPY